MNKIRILNLNRLYNLHKFIICELWTSQCHYDVGGLKAADKEPLSVTH
jgi:hypothetical protein